MHTCHWEKVVFSESWHFEISWIKTKTVTCFKLIYQLTTWYNLVAVKLRHHILDFYISICFKLSSKQISKTKEFAMS